MVTPWEIKGINATNILRRSLIKQHDAALKLSLNALKVSCVLCCHVSARDPTAQDALSYWHDCIVAVTLAACQRVVSHLSSFSNKRIYFVMLGYLTKSEIMWTLWNHNTWHGPSKPHCSINVHRDRHTAILVANTLEHSSYDGDDSMKSSSRTVPSSVVVCMLTSVWNNVTWAGKRSKCVPLLNRQSDHWCITTISTEAVYADCTCCCRMNACHMTHTDMNELLLYVSWQASIHPTVGHAVLFTQPWRDVVTLMR